MTCSRRAEPSSTASVWETNGPREHSYEERYRLLAEEYVGRFLEWNFGREAAKAKPAWTLALPSGTITFEPGFLEHSEEGGTKRVVVRLVKTGKSKDKAPDCSLKPLPRPIPAPRCDSRSPTWRRTRWCQWRSTPRSSWRCWTSSTAQ